PGDRVLLLIEDDLGVARQLYDAASARGWKVVVVAQGEAGFALAHKLLPAAVALALKLPDVDGWAVLDRLKHDQVVRHIPIVLIGDATERQRGLRLGAVGLLSKSASSAEVAGALERLAMLVERPLKRLLLVEDDDTERRSLVELIGNSDVEITAVGTGKEALV